MDCNLMSENAHVLFSSPWFSLTDPVKQFSILLQTSQFCIFWHPLMFFVRNKLECCPTSQQDLKYVLYIVFPMPSIEPRCRVPYMAANKDYTPSPKCDQCKKGTGLHFAVLNATHWMYLSKHFTEIHCSTSWNINALCTQLIDTALQ